VQDVPQAEGRPQELGVGELRQLAAELRAVGRQQPQHQREQRDVPAQERAAHVKAGPRDVGRVSPVRSSHVYVMPCQHSALATSSQ
jgi:hypothetical protein